VTARARKKIGTEPLDVTVVRIRILVGFNNLRAGDESVTDLDPRVQGWVNAGLAEIVSTETVPMELELEVSDGGADPAGPGEPEPDFQGAGEA
jgi:hypothetical protein